MAHVDSYIAPADGKYVLQETRYIDGQYMQASPKDPIVLALPKGYKIDKGLIPVEKYTAVEVKPHFAVRPPPMANPLASAPTVAISEVQVDPVTKTVIEGRSASSAPSALPEAVKVKGGRASDKSV